ncbi:MAG: aquaporin [Armatimonadetes bacterium]|nr:aquaporin [Armatimonadota bacterium]
MIKPSALLAEFIGTFFLIFLGCASVALNPLDAGPIMPAFAHGLAIVFAAYTLGHISGAHINPAVTLAIAIAGKIAPATAIAYWFVQILGGVAGAFALAYILPGMAGQFGAFSFDETKHTVSGAMLMEATLTFALASVVLQAAVRGKAGNVAGLAIGFTLAACILAGGAVTGASLNPARTLGPAFVANEMGQVWVYLIGTLIGGGVAGVLHKVAFWTDDQPS